MAGHIKQAFLNVNMANRFDGLQKIAKESGIDLLTMSPESYLVFVNGPKDKIAMLVGPQIPGKKQCMAYVKLDRGRKLDLRIIQEIPRAFNGKTLDHDKALELAIDRSMKNKASSKITAML